MSSYSFKNDYSEGAHPNILEALVKTNMEQQNGYSDDDYCLKAKQLIKDAIKNTDADIHFVSGGTQTNLIVISSFLKSYESVIAADTAHIEVHETGAIENTGHKINKINTNNGKINPNQIQEVLDYHVDEHMVKPRMVFISNSTELGGIYSKNELQELSKFCKKNNLYLYMDGARLGAALSSKDNDMKISDIAKLVDVFYIGGTKNGAIIGEAIVILNDRFKEHFRYSLKQKGALLAKGRLLGLQFYELFNNNLFFNLAKHSNQMAEKLAAGIKEKGYSFLTNPQTNQIFPILPNTEIHKLEKKFGFYIWKKINNNESAIRLVTSWATKEESVAEFINELKKSKQS